MKKIRILNKDKRNSIIEAAIIEFDRVGYDTASMDKISANANVSKATVYKHFGSKKELFLALIKIFKEELDKYHYIKYDAKQNIKEQLQQFAIQELDLICNPRNMILMRLGINAIMNECEVTPILRDMSQDHIFDNLIQWFEDAKNDGKLIFDDAEFVAQQFVGNIKCFALFPQIYGGAEILEKTKWMRVIDNAVNIILTLYIK